MIESTRRIAVFDWMLSHAESIDEKPLETITQWKESFGRIIHSWSEPVDAAVVGGFTGDRPAYAFASGYEAALRQMVPSLPDGVVAAICVTESGGAHPRAIESRLEPADEPDTYTLSGDKTFVTCANEAGILLVAATMGTDATGRNRIRLAMVERIASGMTITPMEDLPFIPEIKHGTVHLDRVLIEESQLLPGDGYANYIKPFRTIEDLHVIAGLLGYLFREACRFKWPRDIREEILCLLIGIKALVGHDPLAAEVHIATGGLMRQVNNLLDRIEPLWDQVAPEIQRRWIRDRNMLNIAANARAKRLESAWSSYRYDAAD